MIDAQEQYMRQPYFIMKSMIKPGHEEDTNAFDDVKQVMEALERDCRISQDVIRNNLDKTH